MCDIDVHSGKKHDALHIEIFEYVKYKITGEAPAN